MGSSYSYGSYSASHNACEVIAVHDAKVLMGQDSSYTSTQADFLDAHAIIGDGYFGSDPFRIGKVLSNSGIQYTKVGLDEMTVAGTYIISFWNEGKITEGLHTVAVSYDGELYTTYNLSGYGYASHLNPSEYAYKFICGYYLGG